MSQELPGAGSESTSSEENDVKLLSEGEDEVTSEEKDSSEEQESETQEETSDEPTDEDVQDDESELEEELDTEELDQEAQAQDSAIERPSWKEIKEKYPGIEKNKEFREVYFREKEFSEIFSTVNEAKLANENSAVLNDIDNQLATGDYAGVIGSLKPEIKTQFAEKILPTLWNLDQKLFQTATRPLLNELVNEIHAFAEKDGNENLKKSVLNICKYLYGDYKLPNRASKSDPTLDRERKALQDERQRDAIARFEDFSNKSERMIDRNLEKVILDGLDIKNDFIRASVVREVKNNVKHTIFKDNVFRSKMESLYKQAQASGFSQEYLSRIVSAYLGRAKGLALKVRQELKAQALNKRPGPKPENNKSRVEGRKNDNQSTRKESKGTKGMNDMDIIMQGAKD